MGGRPVRPKGRGLGCGLRGLRLAQIGLPPPCLINRPIGTLPIRLSRLHRQRCNREEKKDRADVQHAPGTVYENKSHVLPLPEMLGSRQTRNKQESAFARQRGHASGFTDPSSIRQCAAWGMKRWVVWGDWRRPGDRKAGPRTAIVHRVKCVSVTRERHRQAAGRTDRALVERHRVVGRQRFLTMMVITRWVGRSIVRMRVVSILRRGRQ